MKRFTFRKTLGILLIMLGAYSVVYCFSVMIYRVNFSKFFLALGVICLLAGIGIIFFKRSFLPQKLRPLVPAVKVVISLVVLSFLIIESLIIYSGSKTDTAKVDYLVILGAGLWGDTPSLALQERLDEGIIFIRKNPEVKIILSGGQGSGETITEAEGMRRYLISKGIDEKLLIKEERSTNTKENMKFTKELLSNMDTKKNIKIMVVTNNFHMFRAKLLARNSGFTAYGEPSELFLPLVPAYYTREYLAVIKTLIFDLR